MAKKETSLALPLSINKELSATKAKTTKAASYATGLVIQNEDDYKAAMEEGKRIKVVLENVTKRKEEITKPLNEALKSARDLFKPFETSLETTLSTVKSKMLAWYREDQARAKREEMKIAERVQRGTMKPETAVRKAAAIIDPKKVVKTHTTTASVHTIRTVTFADVTKMQAEDIVVLARQGYLTWNSTKARQDALAGKEIPGIQVVETENLALK